MRPGTAEQRQQVRDDVPKLVFAATVAGHSALAVAKTTLALARRGLARRRRLDAAGNDESRYLQSIEDYVARGITPAEELLQKFNGSWQRSVEPVFKEYAY